jgi:exodeoxyribonuclease V
LLTKRQKEGSDQIKKWFKDQNNQIFVLAGYAGTGKSFMTKQAIDELGLKESQVAYCTYTGKASLVLTQYHQGQTNVSTIHKLIYETEIDQTGEIRFVKRSKLSGIKLIVVDEASMVNKGILDDLKSFKIPILAIGDHGQLPAIGEQGGLMENPDYTLTEILRQAENNPIIYLSKLVREGKQLQEGIYGDKVFIYKKNSGKVSMPMALLVDQVICGYNKTRISMNKHMRRAKGFITDEPQKGDKVIFLENDWEKNLEGYNIVNGMMGYITDAPKPSNIKQAALDTYQVNVKPDFLNGKFTTLEIPRQDFTGESLKLSIHQRKYDINRMTYGDAITCHKSQGSSWDSVLVWNEPFGDEPWRWTYTAITRARNKLVLAI